MRGRIPEVFLLRRPVVTAWPIRPGCCLLCKLHSAAVQLQDSGSVTSVTSIHVVDMGLIQSTTLLRHFFLHRFNNLEAASSKCLCESRKDICHRTQMYKCVAYTSNVASLAVARMSPEVIDFFSIVVTAPVAHNLNMFDP